ncbi:centromere-associated protein E isoform X6 [Oncorhynchus kisutch]|uniref:centromere-associated protein E isoform X6 n=1 Tax=Oncorhynchus kisutch TaxID=8019 RepID=UPI0012DD51AD|nr:centromere-associated protein E isoform X6 [Oncorhynchus kisutch]
MEGNMITTAGTGTGAHSVTMVTGPTGTPDLQVLTHRVKLLEHSLRDNVSSFTESESALHSRIRELEVSEQSLLQKVEDLTSNSVLHCPSMLQRQRLDERLHTLREEVRSMSQEKERGDRVWRERLRRCQAQLRAKEEEMGRQSQYFEHFKSQLHHKLGLARDREQGLQTRLHQMERPVLEMNVSAATYIAPVNTASTNSVTADNVKSIMVPTSGQQRTETERLPHPREEGEGEEEDGEEKTQRRHYGQQLQQKQGANDREIEGEREGEEGEDGESLGGEARLRSFILSLQEDLRVLLEREEQGLAEQRGLMEQLEEAQENNHFLSCTLEEMKTVVHRLKLTESSLMEEVEELQEENQRLCQRLSHTLRQTNHSLGSTDPSPVSTPSLATSLPNTPGLGQPVPCSVNNTDPVKMIPGQASLDTHPSAQHHGATERSQENSTLPLPQPDLLNLSGHRSQNPGLISLGTKSVEGLGELTLRDWCPGPGGFPSLNLEEGTSEETEALKEAYRSMGGDMDSLRDHRDQLESTLRHTQDQLHRVTDENARLKCKLRAQGETGACEVEQGSSLVGESMTNVQENKVSTLNLIPQSCRDLTATPYQNDTILALAQDDLSLYALAQDDLALALNQENRALGRRIQELLAHIESQEGESERELVQLRLQVSLLERESTRLEQENLEQGGLITELTRKTEDDLNTIIELQERRVESSQLGLQQGDSGLTIESESECGQQGEHAVGSVHAQQGQPTVGVVTSLQGDQTPGSVNSGVPQVDHTVESVCSQQEDRLTTESTCRLREKRDELIGYLSDLKEEREQVALSLSSQTEEKHQLTRSMWVLKEERDQIHKSLCSLKEEKEQLTRSLCGLKDERDKVTRSMCGLKEERDQLTRSLCGLKDERDKVTRSMCGLKEERDQLVQSMFGLQEERDQPVQSMSGLQEERDQLVQSMSGLQEERDQLVQSMSGLQEERDQLVQSMSGLQEERDQLVQSMDVLREQREQLTEERDQLQMDVATLRYQLLLQGRSHNQQPSENHVGKATRTEVVATERGVQMPKMHDDGDVTHRCLATVYSYKTIRLAQSAQDHLGEKEGTDMEQSELMREIESLGLELRSSREVLKKTQSEAQRWYRELGVSEVRREEAEKRAGKAANEVKGMREETKEVEKTKRENHTLRAELGEVKSRLLCLEREKTDAHSLRIKIQEKFSLLQAELKAKSVALKELSSEYTSLKGEQGSREDWSNTLTLLRVRYDDIRNKYNVLLRKSQTDLDIAPLKAKLSCLVVKCQQRNSLLVQLMRALRRYGCLDYNLTQEAEDLLNDTALQDYASTFTPPSTAALQENTHLLPPAASERPECSQTSAAASAAQELSKAVSEGSRREHFRVCVATADYCPSPNMPHTLLPMLPLSAGESVQVTGLTDRHGMYHAEVKGESGLVPARFLEENGRPLILTSPSPERCASLTRKLTSPGKIINLHQQLQNTLSNSYQVFPSKTIPQVYSSPPPGQGYSPGYPNHNPAAPNRPKHTLVATTPIITSTSLLSATAPTKTTSDGATSSKQTPNRAHPTTSTPIYTTTTALSSGKEPLSKTVSAAATSNVTTPVNTPPTTVARTVKAQTTTALWSTAPTKSAPPPITAGTTATTKMAPITTTLPLAELSRLPDEDHCIKKPLSNLQPEQAKPPKPRAIPEPPAEVSSVEVIRTVGQSSLMIGWERPPLDELGCSNRTFVYGYMIYVEGEFHKSVMSSACTKCILENLDLSGPVHISVQTLGSNGLYAEKVHLIYRGKRTQFRTDHTRVNTASAAPCTDPAYRDCRTPPTHRHNGSTQPLVAIYNYNPLKDSPNLHPSRELTLREGDTVMLLGNPRNDGFCQAEVNGRRGLAPVALLEEVPVPDRHVSPAPPQSSPERGADDRPLCLPNRERTRWASVTVNQ